MKNSKKILYYIRISERNSIFETSATKSLCHEELKRNFFDCDAMGSDATLWDHRMRSTTPMLLDTLYHSLTYDAQLPGAGVSRLVDLWYGAGNVPAYEVAALEPAPPPAPMYAGDTMWMKDFADNNAALLVYPNPFTDELIILNLQREEMEVKLFDIYGRPIKSMNFKGGITSTMFTGDVKPGVYFLFYKGINEKEVGSYIKMIKP